MTGISARRVVLLVAASAATLVADALAAGLATGGASALQWLAVGGGAGLAAVTVGATVAAIRTALRRDRALRDAVAELDELLGVSDSADESQRLLIGHAQRVLPGAGAGVLLVADGGTRLEPALADRVDQTPLRGIRTAGLGTRACPALRLGRGQLRGPADQPLSPCAICGTLDAHIVCEPLVCGGEAVGTLLVAHAAAISADERAVLHDAAGRAAPILAGQREQALAEQRAVTDTLTELPNRRAADQTIRRMVAHAGRSLSPLGVVLLDLDRFRILNDLHGHSHGDKALAAVGRLLVSTIRASDFAARFGGEEFLLLLPDTDRQGALEVAEKVRRAIERTELVRTGPITASLGVACLPDDAVDPEQLLRQADRALYMAKAHGRNRVEAAGDPSAQGSEPAA